MLHLTARSSSGLPLSDDRAARTLWRRCRRIWPEALAACLMGNHFHLLVDDRPDRARKAVARLVAAVPGWTHPQAPAPDVIADDPRKLLRVLRYIHLNPCRARLVADPLEWRWSTHRDLLGAVSDPWVTDVRWSRWTSMTTRELHAYVSSDPSVDVDGSPLPQPSASELLPVTGLRDIADAAIACTRGTLEDLRRRTATRRMFLHLASDQGWHDLAVLARACAMTRDGVRKNLQLHTDLAAARLCLGDRRLRAREGRQATRPQRTLLATR